MATFTHPTDSLRLHYLDRGSGRPLVLLHGLLWSSRMFVRLRRLLPGHRVILLDLRGHGLSERPVDPELYTWRGFSSDVICLLDHLGIEQAVVGGLSLGANVAIATALANPQRCRGLVVEMPVLERGRAPATRIFSALARTIEAGGRTVRGTTWILRRLPPVSVVPELAAIRDVATMDPESAVAIIRGLIASGLPTDDQPGLKSLQMPALVIGHRRDPLHVMDDARELAGLLPRGRFVQASSILEYRLHPERLAAHLGPFLEEAWGQPRPLDLDP
ncbi:MAG TPA: alpha/beta hydrolase [Actinomycetota bacterium]|nr:alpha/beta hydrolase [Actinomycetota bacterium]